MRESELQFDPALKELLVRVSGSPLGDGLPESVSRQPVSVVAVLRRAEEVVPGLEVVARLGDVVTARVPLGRIVDVRRHENVASLKASTPYRIDLAQSVPAIGADAETLRRAVGRGLDGRGTVVGIIDWGFDFAHDDFRDAAGRTRVSWLWDQRGGPTAASPMPYGYGREFSAATINAALRTRDPYEWLRYDPAQMDLEGGGMHGTHVAGIAVGGGRAPGSSPGVAPHADIIFVHLRGDDTGPADTLGDSVRLLEAVDYVLRRANDRSVVLNLSVGRTGNSKDGTSPVERALDYAATARAGCVVCISAGNYYESRLHASGVIRTGERRWLRWHLPAQRPNAAELEVWYRGSDALRFRIVDPAGRAVTEIELGATAVVHRDGELLVSAFHRHHDPNNGDNHFNVFIHPAAAGGEWIAELSGENCLIGRYDAWIERDGAASQSRFHPDDADPRKTIGTICCGRHSIACAAYDAAGHGLTIAPFSSAGPTRDGRRVPVVAAPGVAIQAARSTWRGADGQRVMNDLQTKSGTSMATPHVAGTVALMQQAAGRPLWSQEVRDIFARTALRPPVRDADWRERYGAGVLNTSAAVRHARRLGARREAVARCVRARPAAPRPPSALLPELQVAGANSMSEEAPVMAPLRDGEEHMRDQRRSSRRPSSSPAAAPKGAGVMESLAHRDIEQLTGALRQLSNEIAEAVNGNVAAGREAESPSSAYLDVGREVGEAAEGILEREEAERLERIIAENNLLPVHFLEEGANVQRAVARVVRNDGAMGSGFLVSRNLFMTNNHVLPSAQIAGGARAEFNFQYDYNGNPRSPDVYRFEPASLYYTNVNLDMSLVRLSPSGSTHAGTRWGRIALRRSVGYARGQHLNIVQHPRGRRKEVALQENRITNVYQNAIRYTTDTEQGSSGSPVFNNGWDVVALHHSGGERRGTVWINNEGIRIDRIVEALRSHFGGSAGGAAILSDLGI